MHNYPRSTSKVPKLKEEEEPSYCPKCSSTTCCKAHRRGYHDQSDNSDIKGDSDPRPSDQNSSSHLLSLLRSGHVPDENEKSSILSTIEDYNSQLDSLNTDLTQLKTIINQLQNRHSELELQISYQKGLLSPIRRLPNELLSEILLYSSGGRVNVSSPKSDIWKFERVCKKWRDISLSSEIWSSIDVSLECIMAPWNPGTTIEMVAQLAELCLRRSRDRSLSVKFEEIGSPVNFKDIFDLFSAYSNRWEELFLSLSMLPTEKSPILDYGLTRLNFLRFSGAYKGSTPLDTFKHAQQLQRLHLFSVPKPLRSLLLPWSQITDFKAILCIFRTGEFVDILKSMPNIVRFVSRWNKGIKKVVNNSAADNTETDINHIHLPHLKSLELVSFPFETYAVLELLICPLLTDLTIISSNNNSDPTTTTSSNFLADSIINTITRSSCQLTSLSLHSLSSTCISRILPYTRWVRYLELGYIHSVDVVLRQLVFLPSESLGGGVVLLPELCEFSLECMVDQGVVCIGPLISVIRSRSCCDDDLGEGGGSGGRGGHLQMVNLTLREKRGVEPFAAILQPLGIETGVGIVIHAIQIGA